jgi:hypothetical protein
VVSGGGLVVCYTNRMDNKSECVKKFKKCDGRGACIDYNESGIRLY